MPNDLPQVVGPSPSGAYVLMNGDTPDIVLAKQLTRIEMNQDQMLKDIGRINDQLASQYVTCEAHDNLIEKVKQLQTIVFGTVGVICMGVVGALLKLVFLAPGK